MERIRNMMTQRHQKQLKFNNTEDPDEMKEFKCDLKKKNFFSLMSEIGEN